MLYGYGRPEVADLYRSVAVSTPSDANPPTAARNEREYSEESDESEPQMPIEERNRTIKAMAAGGMKQPEIAEHFSLTPGRISQIVNSDS